MEPINCNIEEFLETGNMDKIRDCYNVTNIEPIETASPLGEGDTKCYLLTTIRNEFYTHTYEPSILIRNLESYHDAFLDPVIKSNYIEQIVSMINLERRENCCNCFSFVLYLKDIELIDKSKQLLIEKINKLYMYFYSLNLSIHNINNCLPDFIARIYIDISVFTIINYALKYFNPIATNPLYPFTSDGIHQKIIDIKAILDFFISNQRVEIYTYVCSNRVDLMILRYVPLYEENVNIKVMREADGYVSYMDCLNIKQMIKQNKFMFTYNTLSSAPEDGIINSMPNINISNTITYYNTPYAIWMYYYKQSTPVYKNSLRLFDILGGLNAFTIQIKRDIFFEYYEFIKHFSSIHDFITIMIKNMAKNTADNNNITQLINLLSSNTTISVEIIDAIFVNKDKDYELIQQNIFNLISIQELYSYYVSRGMLNSESILPLVPSYTNPVNIGELQYTLFDIDYIKQLPDNMFTSTLDEVFLLSLFTNISYIYVGNTTNITIINRSSIMMGRLMIRETYSLLNFQENNLLKSLIRLYLNSIGYVTKSYDLILETEKKYLDNIIKIETKIKEIYPIIDYTSIIAFYKSIPKIYPKQITLTHYMILIDRLFISDIDDNNFINFNIKLIDETCNSTKLLNMVCESIHNQIFIYKPFPEIVYLNFIPVELFQKKYLKYKYLKYKYLKYKQKYLQLQKSNIQKGGHIQTSKTYIEFILRDVDETIKVNLDDNTQIIEILNKYVYDIKDLICLDFHGVVDLYNKDEHIPSTISKCVISYIGGKPETIINTIESLKPKITSNEILFAVIVYKKDNNPISGTKGWLITKILEANKFINIHFIDDSRKNIECVDNIGSEKIKTYYIDSNKNPKVYLDKLLNKL